MSAILITDDVFFDAESEFELDVQVMADPTARYAERPCDTSDTCAATCASACASS